MENQLTPEQNAALQNLGLEKDQFGQFANGEAVVYLLPTETTPGIAILQKVGHCLRSGIIEINDPGGGLKTLVRFRSRSFQVALAFGLPELELFGAAIINPKLLTLLENQGFLRKTEHCPDSLGGGTMEILAKGFPVE